MGIALSKSDAITKFAAEQEIERVASGVAAGELPPREPPGYRPGTSAVVMGGAKVRRA